jgi:hypothetical protein
MPSKCVSSTHEKSPWQAGFPASATTHGVKNEHGRLGFPKVQVSPPASILDPVVSGRHSHPTGYPESDHIAAE